MPAIPDTTATPNNTTRFTTITLPPWRSFCPQKQMPLNCSSKIRLGWMSSWSAFWSLKYDVWIYFASSAGYPCHSTKNSVVYVWFSNSTAAAKFLLRQSILACLRPQAPHRQKLVALCSLSTASLATCETQDEFSTSQGVWVGMLES